MLKHLTSRRAVRAQFGFAATAALLACFAFFAGLLAGQAQADPVTGGMIAGKADDGIATVAGTRARLTASGTAIAPAAAPLRVKKVIAAANRIAKKPYLWGGGHGSWNASGYDCSGSTSYALHGGGLLDAPMASGFYALGKAGKGRWITTFANSGHVYMEIAGLRYDTSALKQEGSRWSARPRTYGSGFVARHPVGL